MEYVGRFISGVKTFYSEINPATLTGAIDVIVVQQPDGSLVCSPFHVRFGKMGVLRSREKIVDIQINGEPVDLYMKLGESGEAFFVEEMEDEDNVPAHLATSPIPTSGDLFAEGMKELHSQRSRHSRSETESSRESEPPSKTISSSSLRTGSSNSQLLTKEVVDMHSVGEKLADISLEASGAGKAKEKKLTKTKNSLKSLQDVEAGSSQEEDSSSKLDQRLSASGSSPHATDNIAIESETKGNNCRSRIRAKRRRRKSGKGGKTEKTPPQNSNVRRVTSMSESSTSSSQHSDEELEGIFPIDDVEGDDGIEDDGGQVDRPVSLVADELVTQEEWNNLTTPTQRAFHVFSDGDYTPIVSPQATRPSTPKSDTEADHLRQSNLRQAHKAAGVDKFEWNWGELPEQSSDTKSRTDPKPSSSSSSPSTSQGKGEEKKSSIWNKLFSSKNAAPTEGGMYLQDLAKEEVDPEVYALYFPESSTQVPGNRIRTIQEVKDEDKSSDLGGSLPQSPNTVVVSDSESHHSTSDSHHSASDLQHSIDSGQGCEETAENLRGMQLSLCGGLKDDEDTIELDHFKKDLITYEEFIKDPSMLTNPKLVIRINNKFFNWQMAGPVIISQLAFQKPLPVDVTSNIVKDNLPKGRKSLTSWFWGSTAKPSTPKKELAVGSFQDDLLIQQDDDERSLQRKDSIESGPNSADEMELTGGEKSLRMRRGTERYKKAIRLSSDQLAKLNLQFGANEIRYSVTTRYQGTCVCECTIYYWQYNTKIIISDIDGTITKSDVFGQILPVLGKDWTHIGVAQLYSNIKLNGYNFLYLSSRAIGQARLTKGYLNSIQQDKASLPDGPLLLNPSSLFQAFHSEVIIRKPEEFKIKCLKDIESLFPSNIKPFYAGYGNRINDTWAYRAVGIPVSRIFTINPQGKVTHEMTKTFQSSYPRMKDLVDHVFPPLHRQTRMALEAPAEYSGFTYWRSPLPNLAPDDNLLTPP